MYKITILTDTSSWMNKYNINLKNKLEKLGHKVKLIHSKKELENGDIAFFLSCFEIISGEFLSLNKNNIVVHASKLPNGKGWSPASWQILEGKNIIPLTLFEASEKVDAGDIYLQDKLVLDGCELIDEWQDKLGKKIVQMCITYVSKYKKMKGESQRGEETFYKKRTPKDSELDINKTIKEQFNLLRIVDNEKYPAFFKFKNKIYTLKIESVKLQEREREREREDSSSHGKPLFFRIEVA